MKTKLARTVGIFQIRGNKVFRTWRPPFFQRSYRVGAMTKTCWRFTEKFGSPKYYKIHFLSTPDNPFLLWKLDIQKDWFEVVRKNQQIFEKCEKVSERMARQGLPYLETIKKKTKQVTSFFWKAGACKRY